MAKLENSEQPLFRNLALQMKPTNHVLTHWCLIYLKHFFSKYNFKDNSKHIKIATSSTSPSNGNTSTIAFSLPVRGR